MTRKSRLACSLVALVALCSSVHGERLRVLYDFEDGCAGWRLLKDGEASDTPCTVAESPGSGRGRSLLLGPGQAGECGAFSCLPPEQGDWSAFTHLKLKVYCPQGAPETARFIVYLKDGDLNYYQHMRRKRLDRGSWTELSLDITGRSRDWEPHGHYKPWDGYCRQDVQEMGLKLSCQDRFNGSFYVDSIELVRKESALPAQNVIYNLRTSSDTVAPFDKLEVSFNLARTYSNPFDPEVVDVTGCFTGPDGKVVRVPGFFYQAYLRTMDRRAEKLVPMGRSQWKIRFAPRQAGEYQYYVEVDDGERIRSDTGRFRCVEAADSAGGRKAGFVRISSTDPNYFEFDNGEFYYPIGHNVASVHDARATSLAVNVPASEGTYAYDRYLSRMAESGENLARVWMAPWSFEIEWTKAYDVHYQGLGRYNLQNAWRLDHVVEEARKKGIYLMLLISSHGEVGDYESDFWGHDAERMQGSPYWDRYGGPLSNPSEFYTSEEALRFYKNQIRYIVARWSYSTSIMAWEILSEPDLATFYADSAEFGRLGAEFVQRIATHVKSIDHADHLITSGCFRFRSPVAAPMLALEEVDFNTGHVFGGDLEEQLLADLEFMQRRFGKIFLATEVGLTPFAQDPDLAARTIHRILWASHMMPYAGAAATWWWVLIDRWDLYPHYRALSAFARGEDRRGKGYQPAPAHVGDALGRRTLQILALRNDARAFCWVYDPVGFSPRAGWQKREATGAVVRIPDFSSGQYTVEIWDTYRGEILDTAEVQALEGDLSFSLPPFQDDIAVKIRRQGPAP